MIQKGQLGQVCPIGTAGLNGSDRQVGLHGLASVGLSRLNNLGGSSVLYGLGITRTKWAEQVVYGTGTSWAGWTIQSERYINWSVCLVWGQGGDQSHQTRQIM